MIKVINIISDTNIGGAGKCLLAFLDRYDRAKFDLEVFIPFDSRLKEEIAARDVPFTEVPHIADQSSNPKAINQLLHLFRQKKPDIVHTHAAMSARIAAKLYRKCKIVHTRHSVFEPPKQMTTFPRKQINGFLNNYFGDIMIAVSPAARDNLIQIGADEKKIVVVFNGVDRPLQLSATEKNQIRQRLGLKETDFIVAILARLEEVKGHHYVMEAAKKLQQTEPQIKILIVGTGTLEADLRRRKEQENLDNVILTGFVKEIHEIENIMDLQINASYGTEATSLSLLEGMSLSVPAVVSDFGGNPYVIKENINGIVVPKKSTEALYDGILSIKNDTEQYRKLQKNAAEEFKKNYTSEQMAKNIMDVYESLR